MNFPKAILKTGISLITVLLLFILGNVNGQSLYLRAPEVIPGTLPEMRTIPFWIDRMENPDEVVMTLGQIVEMNSNYRQKMSDLSILDESLAQRIGRQMRSSIGLVATMPDLSSQTPAEISTIVRDIVERQVQNLQRRSYGNRLAIQYSDGQKEAMISELDQSSIQDAIEVEKGLVVVNSLLRTIPPIRPEYVGLTQSGKTRWDLWNLDVVPIGSPVQILHVSKTGSFLFVLTERGYGWVESQNIAIGPESDINNYTSAEDFIITTGDRVPFYSTSDAKYVSGWLRMGDRLPLGGSNDPRQVQVPVRKTNGEFTTGIAWLSPEADVNIGYLPYTRRNVVVQGFKLLDNMYDWTGGWFGRNHATALRDIFSLT